MLPLGRPRTGGTSHPAASRPGPSLSAPGAEPAAPSNVSLRLENFPFFPGGFEFGVDFGFVPSSSFFFLSFFWTGVLSLILLQPSLLASSFLTFCLLLSPSLLRSFSLLPTRGMGCGGEAPGQARDSSCYPSLISKGGRIQVGTPVPQH